MGQISLQAPVVGQPNSTEDPKITSNFSVIQTAINGNLDSTNIAPALAQSTTVNQAGQTVKGAVNTATAEGTSSTTYTTLATPDQVAGIVLPVNGLILVRYQAMWSESVAGAARAAIFIGANQLQVQQESASPVGPKPQAAATANGAGSLTIPLVSYELGLASQSQIAVSAGADVTTGQAVGLSVDVASGAAEELGGNVVAMASGTRLGGPCSIFAAAGTYTVSVQFKTSSGTVTASNRKLWVQVASFT